MAGLCLTSPFIVADKKQHRDIIGFLLVLSLLCAVFFSLPPPSSLLPPPASPSPLQCRDTLCLHHASSTHTRQKAAPRYYRFPPSSFFVVRCFLLSSSPLLSPPSSRFPLAFAVPRHPLPPPCLLHTYTHVIERPSISRFSLPFTPPGTNATRALPLLF